MKGKILKLAQEQMKKGGYSNLSFTDIADELSTTRANLHHHFKNKEGLAVAATGDYIEKSEQVMSELFENYRGDFAGFIKELDALIYEDVLLKGRDGSCICEQLVREPKIPGNLLDLAKTRFEGIRTSMEKNIQESQENGKIKRSIAASDLSYLTMSLMFGLSQFAMINDGNPEFLKDIKGSLIKFVKPYEA